MTDTTATMQVLQDFLMEHGQPPWTADFAVNREYVYTILKGAKCECNPNLGSGARSTSVPAHFQHCVLAQLLRGVGGPKEVEFQLNRAHLAALQDPTYWKLSWTKLMTDTVAHLRHKGSAPTWKFPQELVNELIRAEVIEYSSDMKSVFIPDSVYKCGVCVAAGPGPHYPNCPEERRVRWQVGTSRQQETRTSVAGWPPEQRPPPCPDCGQLGLDCSCAEGIE